MGAVHQQELEARYRIRGPLRCDGVGSLQCAEDTATGGRMAIRWLPLEANGAQAVEAIERLPIHPRLPAIRSSGATEVAAFVAMDFPEGRLLSTVEPLDEPALERLGKEIASALCSLHEAQIFHGELSADSVLLTDQGPALLWDAPLVLANRFTDRRGESRRLAHLPQTALFLAPERARGGEPGAAADVYALGVALCMAAGGARPVSQNTLEILHQIASLAWRPEIPAGLSPRMTAALTRMVSPEPQARPAADEIAELLGSSLEEPAPATNGGVPLIVLDPSMIVSPTELECSSTEQVLTDDVVQRLAESTRKTTPSPVITPQQPTPTGLGDLAGHHEEHEEHELAAREASLPNWSPAVASEALGASSNPAEGDAQTTASLRTRSEDATVRARPVRPPDADASPPALDPFDALLKAKASAAEPPDQHHALPTLRHRPDELFPTDPSVRPAGADGRARDGAKDVTDPHTPSLGIPQGPLARPDSVPSFKPIEVTQERPAPTPIRPPAAPLPPSVAVRPGIGDLITWVSATNLRLLLVGALALLLTMGALVLAGFALSGRAGFGTRKPHVAAGRARVKAVEPPATPPAPTEPEPP